MSDIEMSDVRKELEHFAKLAEEKSANEEAESPDKLSNSEEEISDKDTADEYLTAPKNYGKEYAEAFKELPLKWRRYLHAREQEVERGFSDLHDRAGSHKWLDDVYASRSGELQKYGVKSSNEWLNTMVEVDKMLSHKPTDAIKMLSEIYGVNPSSANSPAATRNHGSSITDVLACQVIQKQVDDFVHEVDDNGNQKHPFFRDVVKDVYDLLQKGVVDNLNDAYESAVWFNSATRSKLIAQRSQEALELKSKDAQKSKEAAFSPKGKAVPPTKDLTLREELEMRFAALKDDD